MIVAAEKKTRLVAELHAQFAESRGLHSDL